MAAGFITVHTYAQENEPTTKKKVHMKRVLNVGHIVTVEQHFFLDKNKNLQTVPATAIKMFGMEPIGVKETVHEVEEMISNAVREEVPIA
jgi:hypothetical protein